MHNKEPVKKIVAAGDNTSELIFLFLLKPILCLHTIHKLLPIKKQIKIMKIEKKRTKEPLGMLL